VIRGLESRRLRLLLGDLRDRIRLAIAERGTPRTEEVRRFIREHAGVPEFKNLAITMLLLAEALHEDSKGEEWKET
jgi:hypothetical protein